MQSTTKAVGRYEILAELGRGAMGVVYKARDPKIDRLVAIKTISVFAHTPEEDREFRERLFTEAKAAGRLSHPGIVTVYDVGEDPDTLNPYIVMEYVAGDSLEKRVSESADRFPLPMSLSLVEQVAEALDYAHSQGIVHRDIKPGNILLPENGPPKITDFGIAKCNFAHAASIGESIGTPAFMSPEQLNGESVDGRSDLFSLGVVLYTLLTGYRPFQGNSALTISFKVVNRNPLPATAFDSAFPPELDDVISRAMAKEPAQRYATGREMAAALRALRTTLEHTGGTHVSSFDAAYLEPAATVLKKATTGTKSVPSGSRPLPIHRPAWHDWRYVGAGFLAFAVLGLMIAILPRHQSGSPVPTPAMESAPVEVSSVSARQSRAPASNAMQKSDTSSDKTSEPPRARISRHLRKEKTITVASASSPATPATIVPAKTAEAASRTDSTLRLRVEHHFESAEVFVWVDDKLAYDQTVAGTVKKRMVVFKGVEGHQSDSVRTVSGEHRFRVRVHASDDSYDQTNTISGSLPQEGERQLLIQCDKHKPVRLSIQ